jgi:hypothetical protein
MVNGGHFYIHQFGERLKLLLPLMERFMVSIGDLTGTATEKDCEVRPQRRNNDAHTAPRVPMSAPRKHSRESSRMRGRSAALCRKRVGPEKRKNGELLSVAETAFDVLVTVDTNLRYQLNLASRKIAIVVLQSSSNRLEHLRQYFSVCALAIEKIKPGEVVVIGDAT